MNASQSRLLSNLHFFATQRTFNVHMLPTAGIVRQVASYLASPQLLKEVLRYRAISRRFAMKVLPFAATLAVTLISEILTPRPTPWLV